MTVVFNFHALGTIVGMVLLTYPFSSYLMKKTFITKGEETVFSMRV